MNTNTSIIAGAIVVAGVIVAGAVVFSGSDTASTSLVASAPGATREIPIRLVDLETDHIRGNPEASVTIVEYSDLECPFCARFHPTLTKILEEFPDDVRWVYRQFPLTSIHSRAMGAAIASECVAREAGNTAFWEFTDSVFASQNRIGDSLFLEIAENLGIERDVFQACLKDKTIASLVNEDREEASGAGANGTPFSVMIAPDGQMLPFSGALPYEQVRGIVEQALAL